MDRQCLNHQHPPWRIAWMFINQEITDSDLVKPLFSEDTNFVYLGLTINAHHGTVVASDVLPPLLLFGKGEGILGDLE
eukprot:8883555-Ditylum_brightwellii.AAC.1